MEPIKFFKPEQIKAMRVQADALFQLVDRGGEDTEGPDDSKSVMAYMRAEGQAMVKLIEAKMWMGRMLEALGMSLPAELADKSTFAASTPKGISGTAMNPSAESINPGSNSGTTNVQENTNTKE